MTRQEFIELQNETTVEHAVEELIKQNPDKGFRDIIDLWEIRNRVLICIDSGYWADAAEMCEKVNDTFAEKFITTGLCLEDFEPIEDYHDVEMYLED